MFRYITFLLLVILSTLTAGCGREGSLGPEDGTEGTSDPKVPTPPPPQEAVIQIDSPGEYTFLLPAGTWIVQQMYPVTKGDAGTDTLTIQLKDRIWTYKGTSVSGSVSKAVRITGADTPMSVDLPPDSGGTLKWNGSAHLMISLIRGKNK